MVWLLFVSVAFAEVVFVMEFARHGVRTPLLNYDWSLDEDLGQLTQAGFDQHVALGQYLRERYPNLLSSDYSDTEIYLRSTSFNRTIMSTQGQLKGLFPNSSVEAALPNIKTLDVIDDFLLLPSEACPRIYWLVERDAKNSAKYINYLSEFDIYRDLIFRLTGDTELSIDTLGHLGDLFLSYESRNLPIPEEIDEQLVKLAKGAYLFYMSSMIFGNREALKLAAHRFIYEILDKTADVISGNSKLKLAVYMGHDVTLIAFLKILGFYTGLPEPAASLLIELHRLRHGYYLQFYYEGELKVFPECEEFCPLDTFEKLTSDRLYPSEAKWLKTCLLEGDDASQKWWIYLKFGGGILSIIGVMALVRRMLQKMIDSIKKKAN